MRRDALFTFHLCSFVKQRREREAQSALINVSRRHIFGSENWTNVNAAVWGFIIHRRGEKGTFSRLLPTRRGWLPFCCVAPNNRRARSAASGANCWVNERERGFTASSFDERRCAQSTQTLYRSFSFSLLLFHRIKKKCYVCYLTFCRDATRFGALFALGAKTVIHQSNRNIKHFFTYLPSCDSLNWIPSMFLPEKYQIFHSFFSLSAISIWISVCLFFTYLKITYRMF